MKNAYVNQFIEEVFLQMLKGAGSEPYLMDEIGIAGTKKLLQARLGNKDLQDCVINLFALAKWLDDEQKSPSAAAGIRTAIAHFKSDLMDRKSARKQNSREVTQLSKATADLLGISARKIVSSQSTAAAGVKWWAVK